MKLRAIIFAFILIIPIFLPAQENRLSMGLRSSRFTNQENISNSITSIDNPLSIGYQIRYKTNPNVSFQLAGDYLRGNMSKQSEKETLFHLVLGMQMYVFNGNVISPYLSISGSLFSQSKAGSNFINKGKIDFGVGADVKIFNSVFMNGEINALTDGWNYNGGYFSLGLGYYF